MAPIVRVLLSVILLMAISAVPLSEGKMTGKHNQAAQGCTCHYNGGGMSATHDFPSIYTPGQTYTINIGLNGGTQASVGGFSLQVNKGVLTNPGSLVQIDMQATSATHTSSGSLTWTLDWVAPTAGSGTASMNLAVLQGDGDNGNGGDAWNQASSSITEDVPANNPPTASNLALTPNGNVEVNQSITLSYSYADDDDDLESNTQIRWYVDGSPRTAFNDQLTISSSATSVGETWTAKVTPYDGNDFGSVEDCPDSANIIDIDSDGDGTLDGIDAFPSDPNEDTDSDSDGVGDNADAFPNDPNEDTDSDNDSVGDNADAFPNDPNEDTDSDSDGVGDNADAFPNDPNEDTDSDNDSVGDNADAFDADPTETIDSDGDGTGDNADAFDEDPTETTDSDGDGTGDNADAFDADPTETTDSDGDLVGDNADAFPNDPNEDTDSDNDSVGDNADAFPNDPNEDTDSDNDSVGDNADAFDADPTETTDSDGDGTGDNSDVFPANSNESMDSDLDGVGDNADAFPEDGNETLDTDGDGVGDNAQLAATLAAKLAAAEEDDSSNSMVIIGISVLLIALLGAGLIFMRKNRGEEIAGFVADSSQQLMPGQFQPLQPAHAEAQVAMPQQVFAQPIAAQPVVSAEPAVVKQWTDEKGNTWRSMDNGVTLWWNGTDWQQA